MKKVKCSKKTIFYMMSSVIFILFLLNLRFKVSNIYADAIRLYNEKDYDNAIEKFDSLGDYKDSYEYIEKAKNEKVYEEAFERFENEQYEEALELFDRIITYRDSEKKVQEVKYKLAINLYETGEYSEAEQLFSELGTYLESALYKAKCSLLMIENDKNEIYKYAHKLYREKDFDSALSNFLQISDYKDSSKYINLCEEHIRRYNLSMTICAE